MRRIIIPKEEVKNIIADYQNGHTISKIASKYGYDRAKIRSILKEEGIYKKKGNYGIKYNWSQDNIKSIINMYVNDNLSANDIAKKYNCYDTTILDILNKNGIDTKRKRIKHNFTKYEVNENYFDVIDNEEKAYWFGFLLADGHVTNNGKIMLTLQEEDYEHLEKFKDALDSNHPIHKHKTYGSYNITIGSKKLNQSLWDKGFNNNKSWDYDVIKIISYVPKELINHFIRGYFDGDGCVGIYKQSYSNGKIYHVSILGIKPFLEYIKQQVNIKCQIKHDKRTFNTYQLIIRNKEEILRFKEYLYKDANIFMVRKYNIFNQIT